MKGKIENTAKKILEAREQHKNASLAEMYNIAYMPTELKRAHIENDKAVWEAYEKAWNIGSEEDCVAYLMKRYKALTKS